MAVGGRRANNLGHIQKSTFGLVVEVADDFPTISIKAPRSFSNAVAARFTAWWT
jgi:hypothetical protein